MMEPFFESLFYLFRALFMTLCLAGLFVGMISLAMYRDAIEATAYTENSLDRIQAKIVCLQSEPNPDTCLSGMKKWRMIAEKD